MITVGLIKELSYIVSVFGKEVSFCLESSVCSYPIDVTISNTFELSIRYGPQNNKQLIWRESLANGSFFGVESCDAISRIIACIDNATTWQQYKWTEKLDKVPTPV
jgi:hypothetical protein